MIADALDVTTYRPLPEIQLAGGETGVDVTSALRQALRDAPRIGRLPDLDAEDPGPLLTADRNDRAATILFPSLPAGFTYYLTQSVVIPGDKNLCLRAEPPRGTRIRTRKHGETSRSFGGPSRPAFISAAGPGAGRRVHLFESLVLHGGGVGLQQDAKGFTGFTLCSFHNITTWAIETLGPGVVGVRIVDCEFSQMTGGGVRIGHSGCDNWLIGDNSRFARMGGVGVEIRSPSVHVRDARFEHKLKGSAHNPYIRVADADNVNPPDPDEPDQEPTRFSGGLTRISGCRFGGEVGKDPPGPPAYDIELSPDDPGSSTIIGVLIEGNWFFGRTAKVPDPDERSGVAAIRIGRNAHACSVSGNFFRAIQYSAEGRLIDDRLVQPPPPAPPFTVNPGVNSFIGNAVQLSTRRLATPADIFAGTGAGWSVLP
jgi:hypothetical protein